MELILDNLSNNINGLESVKHYEYLGLMIENTGKSNKANKQLF